MKTLILLLCLASFQTFAQEEGRTVYKAPSDQLLEDLGVRRNTFEDLEINNNEEFQAKRAEIQEKIRTKLLTNIYADCYGREMTEEELNEGLALTPNEVLEILASEECRSEDAQARRRERRPENRPIKRIRTPATVETSSSNAVR